MFNTRVPKHQAKMVLGYIFRETKTIYTVNLQLKEFHPLDFETQTGITTPRSEIDPKLTTMFQSCRFQSFDLLRNIKEALSLGKTWLIRIIIIKKLKDHFRRLPLPDDKKMLPFLGILIEL